MSLTIEIEKTKERIITGAVELGFRSGLYG
jgi:hypothetical protein